MKKIIIALLALAFSLFANMTPMGPLNAGSGKVTKQGKIRVAFIHQYTSKDEAYNGNEKIANTKDRKSTSKVTKLKLKYGLLDNLSIKMVVPYMDKKSRSNTDSYNNSGLGDMLLKTNYQILSQKKGAPVFWSFSLGLKLDTAQTNKSFDTSKGVQVLPRMQLGTGSTDYYIESGITKFFDISRIDGYVSYIKTTKGANNYEYGDTKKLDLSYAYAISKPLGFQAVLTYLEKSKHKENNQELNYTGGTQIYITPAITYKINKKYDISAGYTKFLKVNMNYDNSKKIGELVANDAFVLKFGMNF